MEVNKPTFVKKTSNRLLEKKDDAQLLQCYLNYTAENFRTVLRSNGKKRILDIVIKHVEDTYVEDFDDLIKINRLKKDMLKTISNTEITTAVALVNNGVSFSWENFRLFKSDQDKNFRGISPDFITNLITDNRLILVEYHALELEKINTRDPVKKKEKVGLRLKKWSDCISERGYFMIFGGDLKREELLDACRGELPNFTDIYIPIPNESPTISVNVKVPDVFLNDGSKVHIKLERDKFQEDRRQLLRQIKILEHESRRFGQKVYRYFSVLDTIFKNLNRDGKINKIPKDDFLEIFNSELEKSLDTLIG